MELRCEVILLIEEPRLIEHTLIVRFNGSDLVMKQRVPRRSSYGR